MATHDGSHAPGALAEDERAILEALYRYVHLTTEQVWRIALPGRSKRTSERTLEGLRGRRLIVGAPLAPEDGARSPLSYHLLLAGARAIGQARLSSHYYRAVRQEAFAARQVNIELDLLARQGGWRLVREEAEMRQALLAYLAYLAANEHGVRPPAHTLAGLLPARLAPDLLLVTPTEVIPVIVAHPQSGRPFWHDRLKRYAPIITQVRAIAIVVASSQQDEAEQVIRQSAWPRRYLILQAQDVPTLLMRLQ